jgi:uncharacterized protein (DUF362 family)
MKTAAALPESSHVTAIRSFEATSAVMHPLPPGGFLSDDSVREHPAYKAVDHLFEAMGLDVSHARTPKWNPLGEIIRPGERVTIKPNLVYHKHYSNGLLQGVIADPRVIRAVCDYALRAVGTKGQVVVGDAPLQSADWDRLIQDSGLGDLASYYRELGSRFEMRDFRTFGTANRQGLKVRPRKLPGDPLGYRTVSLGTSSLHYGRNWRAMRVTNYDPVAMKSHHNADVHEYLVAGSVLEADVVINIAKLKTHRKSGLTGPLKNFVGVNGCKDWLPHHTRGSVQDGGDEYATSATWKRLCTWLVEHEEASASAAAKVSWNAVRRTVWKGGRSIVRDKTSEGSWFGNDTLWRTILDLNRAVNYADRHGLMQPHAQRRVFTIVDALLAGEGEGPMAPSPAPLGVLLGGINPVAVEHAATSLGRWPIERLKHLARAFDSHEYALTDFPPEAVRVQAWEVTDGVLHETDFEPMGRFLRPSSGWCGAFSTDVPRVLNYV